MNAEKKDLVIFTGQSGIKIESCIGKLAHLGLDFQFVPVDKLISVTSGEKFVEVLGAPPSIQNILWTQAFEQAQDVLQPTRTKHDFTFLTFHACYYHQKKTEFVCPVNLNQLVQLKDRTKMIIVLIDDCYDIYRRLMDKDQMYEDVLNSDDSLDTLLESICNITNLLTWRETEIAFSRKIAQLLDVSMYVISVKHPDFMIPRLISAPKESLKILYLSHPISVIRRQVSSARLSEFYAELSSFIKDVLKPDNVVLFVPDTIDEYRIKHPSIEESRYYYNFIAQEFQEVFPDSVKDDMEGYLQPPLKAHSEGGQSFANRADDFWVFHRHTQHPHRYLTSEWHVAKVKDTDTGGKVTFNGEPVFLDYNFGLGFTMSGNDPLRTKKQSDLQANTSF